MGLYETSYIAWAGTITNNSDIGRFAMDEISEHLRDYDECVSMTRLPVYVNATLPVAKPLSELWGTRRPTNGNLNEAMSNSVH
jgi:hypothetical protein